jgi:CBS domain-containing protein
LSQKPDPDLRNAIKEAISSVESAARVLTGKPKATLSDAIKILEKARQVHPALKDAWIKLYGYTSDEPGVRHAMTEEPGIDFATAKYMVVSCAAFVNLLSTLLCNASAKVGHLPSRNK